jgi:hypothetical protein
MIVLAILACFLLAGSVALQFTIYLYLKSLVKTPWYYKENRYL